MPKKLRYKKNLTTLDKILLWFDKRYYGFSTLMFFIGFALLTLYFLRPHVKSEKDLVSIKGKLASHLFQEKQGGRGIQYIYYIWLENYSNTFQVTADYIDYFEHAKFENEIQPKEMLYLTIPKDHLNRLNDKDSFALVMSVNSKHGNFLDLKTTMRFEKYDYDLYGAVGLISIGIMWFLYQKRKLR